ncbi:uncharacterized protein LOC116182523 [Photinus pyralis]|uniref:uncharacterized protein LOC116182523 n=1 Tax=Photinus pyralis TaxID=7054 RepID=UPI001266F52D|nr:uncharacterized protein LOC116182523 [Photinus pyralis]
MLIYFQANSSNSQNKFFPLKKKGLSGNALKLVTAKRKREEEKNASIVEEEREESRLSSDSPPPPPSKKQINILQNILLPENTVRLSQILMPPPPLQDTTRKSTDDDCKFDRFGDALLEALQLTPTENAEVQLRIPPTINDITRPYIMDDYYVFCNENFLEGYYNARSKLDVECIFGIIIYLAYMAYDKCKSIVLNVHYTIAVCEGRQSFPNEGTWGNPENFEVMFIPIFFPGHFALVIHERNGRTIFYDPIPAMKNLEGHRGATYLPAIKAAIRYYDASFRNDEEINVEIASATAYNLQQTGDDYNCGYYVSLYVETYLMNDKRMLLADFNIATERRRISELLRELCNNVVPIYEPRPDNPFDYSETVDDEVMEVVEEAARSSANDSYDSDVSMRSTSSTSSRRSIRSRSSTSSRPETPSNVKKSKLKSLRYCNKKHGVYGCFATCAGHDIQYLDCGKIGDKVCPHCKALLFKNETTMMCCKNGEVKLPPIKPVPEEIRNLTKDPKHGKHFLQYFRIYNQLLQFGSVEAGRKPSPGQGAPVILINGEIKRQISPLFTADGKTPVHGQLYMLDPMMMAESVSKNSLFQKFGIKREILNTLFDVLRRHHPLCESFQIMHTMYMEKLIEARQQGLEDVQHVTLVLVDPKRVPREAVDANLHPRAVNLPQVNEICAFYVSNEREEPIYRCGTYLKKKDGRTHMLPIYDRLNDCSHYVLNLANGDFGYHPDIKKVVQKKRRRTATEVDENAENANQPDAFYDDEAVQNDNVSMREFYRYYCAIRDEPTGETHFLFPYGNITQEYMLDQSVKVDQQLYEFIKKNYDTLCTTATEVRDYLQRELRKTDPNKTLGKVLRLTTSVVGSPAWYQQYFHDSMAMFQRIGRPTFMITTTSNPTWKEVKNSMMKNQNVVDRPDVLCRVFAIKINMMRDLIEKKHIFGKPKAFLEALEFQKRGGPHTHRLISVDCPHTPEFVDEYISAEIPVLPPASDKSEKAEMQRRLHDLVIKLQIHTCNFHCLNEKKKCSRGFPKRYSNVTIIYEDKPAVYKRRSPDDGGTFHRTTNGRVITNSWVVPYNPAYLLALGAHSNVEFAYGDAACKYLVKYHFKMGNFAYVQIAEGNTDVVDYDETQGIMKGHYRSAMEAYARLYSWRIIRMSHTVYRLNVHLEGEGPQYFRRGAEDKVKAKIFEGNAKLSQLEMFMKQCLEESRQQISEIRNVTFAQLPETHWFNQKTNRWQKRKRQRKIVGRLYPVLPNHTEKFALYQLLLYKKGPLGWDDLKTPPNSTTPCKTFVECAKLMGLLDDIEIWRRTLFEASNVGNPRTMRNLFAQILLLGYVADPLALWNEFLPHMYDTRNLRQNDEVERSRRINIALCLLNRLLGHHFTNNAFFHIPMPENYNAVCDDENEFFFGQNRALDGENESDPTLAEFPLQRRNDDAIETEDIGNYATLASYLRLNEEQKIVVDIVVRAMQSSPSDATTPRLVFMNGAGGTGKTFVYKTIIDMFIKYRRYVIMTASTGVAAQLLPRGMTVHKAFSIPLDVLDVNKIPSISGGSVMAQRIRKSEAIIIDEISMLHKNVLRMVNEACKNVEANNETRKLPFAGKVILLGGDFR